MLRRVGEGVLIHQSEFCQSNTVVVEGRDGVLLIDPGIRRDELACLANDLSASHHTVVAGFSTHPHWDHLLWDARLGAAPRYGTARGAATIEARMAAPTWSARLAGVLPTDLAHQIPRDLLGLITGLPVDAAVVPWKGPHVRLLEHDGHAPGHAALLIEEHGVLVAGDMLSDLLIPMLDVGAADPVDDYLAALQLLEDVAATVDVVIPGHGSIGTADQIHQRIDRDRAYVRALRDGIATKDPRIEQLREVHESQRRHVAEASGGDG